jgi:hypothetical protein
MLIVRQIIARAKFVIATILNKEFIPTCYDFLLLNKATQLRWIENQYVDYEQSLYEPEAYIGLSYPVEMIDLEEYRRYPLDYGITGRLTDLTVERKAEINAGAHLLPDEAEAVMLSVAEADTDTWVGHHGFEIRLSDGTLFVHFEGHSMGQGGVQFNYCEVMQSKDALIKYIENQPISMLEV